MVTLKLEKISVTKYMEMRAWCQEQYGKESWWIKQLDNPASNIKWHARSQMDTATMKNINDEGTVFFAFKDDKDATMFSLVWG